MSSKTQQIKKAQKASKSTKKGVVQRKYKVRNNLRFYKPKTQALPSQPKYARSNKDLKMPAKRDKFSVLIHPLST